MRQLISKILMLVIFVMATSSISIAEQYESEHKGVWISYFEMQRLLLPRSEESFKSEWQTMLRNMKAAGFNTVYVHVRPFGDAMYDSKEYPWSFIATGKEGQKPTFDPLKTMIDLTHEEDMRLEAWINPYRLRNTSFKIPFDATHPAYKWLKDGSRRVVSLKNGIYYNPSHPDVRKKVVRGVEEIVRKYNVDGIHFDDYFYPTSDKSLDAVMYSDYLKKGGKLKLADWRRENVDVLVKSVYSSIKTINRNVVFGISPQGIMKNNYDSQYIDVEKWATQKGYVDYLCPQVYFGFKNTKQPYEMTLEQWKVLQSKSHVKFYIGLAAYKIGLEDKYAGGGKTEWIMDQNILKTMIQSAKQQGFDGYAVFRYDSLWRPDGKLKTQIEAELGAIKKDIGQ